MLVQHSRHLIWLLTRQPVLLHERPSGIYSVKHLAWKEYDVGDQHILDVQEFIRVGYYINNEYWEEELRETPPERPIIERWA